LNCAMSNSLALQRFRHRLPAPRGARDRVSVSRRGPPGSFTDRERIDPAGTPSRGLNCGQKAWSMDVGRRRAGTGTMADIQPKMAFAVHFEACHLGDLRQNRGMIARLTGNKHLKYHDKYSIICAACPPRICCARTGCSACFLRNSPLKSAPRVCGKGASSLRGGAHPLISGLRRRGASPGRAFRVDGSHQVQSPSG
jgi:hypothetical protein